MKISKTSLVFTYLVKNIGVHLNICRGCDEQTTFWKQKYILSGKGLSSMNSVNIGKF